MTDLDRFDELYNNIMEGGNTPRNYLNCMQMMELYEDDIRIDSSNEAIIISSVTTAADSWKLLKR